MVDFYISYGLSKSASTFAWQLIKRIAIAGGLPIATLTAKSKGRNSPVDYIARLSGEKLRLVRADVGAAPVVIKTHAAATPAAVRLVAEGKALVFASYRDLRDVSLSLLDHGARSRLNGSADFADLHTIRDTLPLIEDQVRRLEGWVNSCAPLLIPYDEICFDTRKTTARIAERMGLAVDVNSISAEFESNKDPIGQFNKGQRRRFEQEMSTEDIALLTEKFKEYYEKYLPNEVADRPHAASGSADASMILPKSVQPAIAAPERLIYLHIGTPKTGTTAIQYTARDERDLLMKHGILYPKVPGGAWHYKFALYAMGAQDLRRLAGLDEPAAWEKFRQSFAVDLQNEIERAGCPTVCFSCENLSLRVTRVSEVKLIADLLKPLGAVKVICYLRPQHDLFVSANSTSIKNGRTRDRKPPSDPLDRYYNYERMLDPWATVFGESNTIVRIYDRQLLKNGDIVADFFSLLNYKAPEDRAERRDFNPSLDPMTLQFLLLINKHIPRYPHPERRGLAEALEAISTGTKPRFGADELRRIFSLYEPSNSAVARRFLARSDGVLFPSVEFAEQAESEELTPEKAVEIAAHLWRWKRTRAGLPKQSSADWTGR